MVDSADRAAPATSAWNFQVSKKQNLANGFFTRLGATEVVLEWAVANIAADDTLIFQMTSGTYTVNIDAGSLNGVFMTVADVLQTCVRALNTAIGGTTISVAQNFGVYGLSSSNLANDFIAVTGTLATKMNFIFLGTPFISPENPDLRLYRYLDFLSTDLTYNQNVKDSMTSLNDNNVLVRWYMAYDNPVAVDDYNFPVLMGYTPFQLRRLYNPPKQIGWDPRMPVSGSLNFRVLGTLNLPLATAKNPVEVTGPGEWMMTIQLSEN
jgi:hypothetical protein